MITTYIVFFISLWIHGCKSQCAKENPFYMIDKGCANFNDVCVKKDNDKCQSLLQACAQCPTSNLTESALVNMLKVLRDQQNTTTSHFDAILNNFSLEMKSQMNSSTLMVIIIIAICVIGVPVILLVVIEMRWQPFKLFPRNAGAIRDKEATPLIPSPRPDETNPQTLANIQNQIQKITETLSELKFNETIYQTLAEIQNEMKSINFNIESVRVIEMHKKQILIKSIFDKEEVHLQYLNVDSIRQIKEKIASSLHSDVGNIILFCGNKNLNDDVYVFEIDIEQLKFCHLKPLDNNHKITPSSYPQGDFSIIYKYTDSEEIVLKKYALGINDREYPILKENKDFLNELITFQITKSHGGFVSLNDVFTDTYSFYISMEKMEESIKDYIANNHPLSEVIIAKWAKQILSALQCLHDRKIIHRNIKPSSIFLDKSENIKLSSFGLGKYSYLDQRQQQSRTGKFRYKAPEHCNGENGGVKSDIWSFGATMIEMATGKQPFYGKEEGQATMIIGKAKRIPYELDQTRSSELKDFIDKCVIDQKDRATVDDLLDHEFLCPPNDGCA